MRKISSELAKKLALTKQVKATDSDPKASIWIHRPTIPLTDDKFLEKQTVLENTSVSDVSIAVCHPRENTENTHIYIAYIQNGIAKVMRANSKARMASHVWTDMDFNYSADSISIAFDGEMPKNINGEIEFVTQLMPWIFWTYKGVLYGWQLNTNSNPIILAEENCTDVSAIRAIKSTGFDFGLSVFFIVQGYLYYRQLINGTWYDAEVVSTSSFEEDNTWKTVAAVRTWDYRIVLQAKNINGKVYEIFGQYEGLAKNLSEHVEISDVGSTTNLIGITYYNGKNEEHSEISNIESVKALYGGLYSTDVPEIISIKNIADDSDDWGTTIVTKFNVHMNSDSIASNYTSYKLSDSSTDTVREFTPYSATLADDGMTVTFKFLNFNSAIGKCTFAYTPGDLKSMANVLAVEHSIEFYPKNLVNTGYNTPEIVKIWNE